MAGAEFAGFVADLLAPLGDVQHGRFFSGYGFRLDGVQFAMIIRDTLYLRSDDALAAELAALGSKPFAYGTSKRMVTVASYYAVPEDRLDDADQVLGWARRAVIAAQMKPLTKKRAKRRK
jgi:DNA transformation protein and related proteins